MSREPSFEDEPEPRPSDRADAASPARRDAIESFVDEVLPEGWERIVRAYPIPALLVAAVSGYFLGRHKGSAVVGALSGFAADRVADFGVDLLGRDA